MFMVDRHQLEEIISYLQAQNSELISWNEKLMARVCELEAKVLDLEYKLNINSSNSGLPTSKEIYRLERKSRPKSGKRPGGQVGHKHNPYTFKQADEVVEVFPEAELCKCGGVLSITEGYSTHQRLEIPPIKPIVTEYKLREKVCTDCSKKYKARLSSYKLLGSNSEAIITSLSGYFNNSKREIQQILKSIFNLDLSLGLISTTEGRVSDKLKDKYNELLTQAEDSSYLHFDETSSNNQGKRHWCWVATNQELSVYKLSDSRGKGAFESFFPEYEGRAITDRYAVYNVIDNNKRQICLAHLRRDFKRFAHSQYPVLQGVGKELVEIIDAVFKYYKLYKAGRQKEAKYLCLIRKLQDRMLYYLKDIANLHECKQARRVANNILKSFNMMWLFVKNPEIEPTNNHAERQIKQHVKYRKNSYHTWSNRGDRFLERIKSLFATSILQGLNPWQELHSQLT